MNDESTMKCEFPDSIEIEICEIFANAEALIKSTSRGIVIDLRAEELNADDSMRLSRESFANEIDESDSQFQKQSSGILSMMQGSLLDNVDTQRLQIRINRWLEM
jgi:hypothetical protein